MPEFFVKNGTGGTDDGESAANAAESILDVCNATGGVTAVLAAGDTIWVDTTHSDPISTATNYNFPTTISDPVKVIVVDNLTDLNAVSSVTATSTFFGAGSSDDITFNGAAYFWGVRMYVPGDLRPGTGSFITVEQGYLKSNQANQVIGSSGDSGYLLLIDTDIEDYTFLIARGSKVNWVMGSWVNGTQTALDYLMSVSAEGAALSIRDVDLSDYSGTYVALAAAANDDQNMLVKLERCKMWSGWSPLSGTHLTPNQDALIELTSCHVDDDYNFFYTSYYTGEVRQDSGIYRTGSVADFTAKLTTLATGPQEFISPIRHKLVPQYIDISTEKTLSVHFTYDDATVLNDDDMWLEIDYNNATDEALGVLASTKATTPTTTPGRTPFTDVSGSETWTGTGGFSNPQEETLEKAITGGAGIVTVWVCLAKPLTTVYVDPDVTVS